MAKAVAASSIPGSSITRPTSLVSLLQLVQSNESPYSNSLELISQQTFLGLSISKTGKQNRFCDVSFTVSSAGRWGLSRSLRGQVIS